MINRDGVKKILKLTFFILIIVIVIGYSFFSFRDYISGPKIIITYPENGSTMSTTTVEIKGQALHIRDITINNKPLIIDKLGNFVYTLLLFPGYNSASISAKDKFNRITEYKLELVYKKPTE